MTTRKLIFSAVGAQAARFVLTVVSGPILSRLVGPVPYGILAPAQSLSSLGKLLADSGLAAHAITAKDVSGGQARTLHGQSLRLALGVALFAGFVAAAIGDVPAGQRLVRALVAMLLILLAGTASMPTAWAQWRGKLASPEWFGVAAQTFATVAIAVPLAIYGAGLTAAGANLVVPVLLTAMIAWRVSALREHSAEPVTVEAKYRREVLAANTAAYFSLNIDVLILSTYFSTDLLGVYSRVTLLATLPGNVVARRAGRMMAQSPYTLECWKKEMGRKGAMELVPNGVSESVLALGTGPAHNRSRVFASVCTGFGDRKNTKVLLQAFAIVRQSEPAALLRMYGSGYGPTEEAQAWAASRRLDDGVDFVGHADRMKILRSLRDETAALVHPSLEESFGMSIAEAMAVGLPVVGGKDAGPVPWLLDDGKAGMVCDVRDPNSIAAAMLESLDRPDLRVAAPKRIREAFTLSAVTNRYLSILSEAAR